MSALTATASIGWPPRPRLVFAILRVACRSAGVGGLARSARVTTRTPWWGPSRSCWRAPACASATCWPTPDLVARCRVRQPAWSVGGLAAAALPELLAAADLPGWCAGVARLRGALSDLLASHGLAVRPSDANWVLVDRGGLREALAPHGVVVRDCASFGLPGVTRVAVPSEEGLERLDAALAAATSRSPSRELAAAGPAGRGRLVGAASGGRRHGRGPSTSGEGRVLRGRAGSRATSAASGPTTSSRTCSSASSARRTPPRRSGTPSPGASSSCATRRRATGPR